MKVCSIASSETRHWRGDECVAVVAFTVKVLRSNDHDRRDALDTVNDRLRFLDVNGALLLLVAGDAFGSLPSLPPPADPGLTSAMTSSSSSSSSRSSSSSSTTTLMVPKPCAFCGTSASSSWPIRKAARCSASTVSAASSSALASASSSTMSLSLFLLRERLDKNMQQGKISQCTK